MNQLLRYVVERIPPFSTVRGLVIARKEKKTIEEWEKRGKPAPPPHVIKQRTIREYANKFNLKTLVETGTYRGEMVEAMKNHFNEVYSIELSTDLYEKAKQKFAGDARIKLINGDSGTELGKLVAQLKQPALFWLDGHYSGGITARGAKDTPVYEELTHIFDSSQKNHVIIIDDARCFGTDSAYPTIDELSNFIKTKRPRAQIEVDTDSIRIIPHD